MDPEHWYLWYLMGKKYHENNARADKKGEKERKDKGKEKISDKKTEQDNV